MSSDRRAHRVAANRILNSEALLGNEPFGWISFHGLPRDCVLHSFPGIEGHNRPVTAKGENAAVPLNASPRPRTLATLWPYIAEPHIQGVLVLVSMERLKARDHAELSEARNVFRGHIFNVFDAVTPVFRSILLARVLVGIE